MTMMMISTGQQGPVAYIKKIVKQSPVEIIIIVIRFSFKLPNLTPPQWGADGPLQENLGRTATAHKCAAVLRWVRIQGSSTFVSLNSRLEILIKIERETSG